MSIVSMDSSYLSCVHSADLFTPGSIPPKMKKSKSRPLRDSKKGSKEVEARPSTSKSADPDQVRRNKNSNMSSTRP